MRFFKCLTYTDRLRIEGMLKQKMSKQDIANTLRVHVSTIYREVKRGEYEHLNSDYTTETRYSADIAQSCIDSAKSGMGADLKIGKDHELANFLENLMLNESFSPGAALGEIKRKNLKFKTTICETTLYSYIRKGVFLTLTMADLPRRGQKKQKHQEVKPKNPPRGESIEKRPDYINDRSEEGHWEMDTVVGRKKSKKALLVLTERKMRKEIIIRMPDKTAASTVKALDKLERKMGKEKFRQVFKSITVDNGCEFADCKGMERSVLDGQPRTKVYFCHPYSAYERGSNENQNLLIRRFFPKGISFDRIPISYIQRVEDWINNYPREILGYKAANDLFNEYLLTLTV